MRLVYNPSIKLRLVNKMCSKAESIIRNLSRALSMRESVVAAWNARMLMDIAGKAIYLNRVDVACLPVVHILHFGSRVITKTGSKRYCGTSERNGVGIVMFEKAHSVLIKWKPANNRMAYARFKGKFYLCYQCLCSDFVSR